MRWQWGPVLGLVCLAGCAVSPPQEDVYFVRQSVTVEGHPSGLNQSGFHAVTLSPGDDGSQTVRKRTLWSKQTVSGRTSGTLTLDPANADEQQHLALLASGFEVTVDKEGRAQDMRAVDQKAFAAMAERRPELAQAFTPRENIADMRPLRLPDHLSVGHEVVREETTPRLGRLTSRLRVSAVTDEAAVVDVQVEGRGVHGKGRQAIRRRDGMPIEMRLELVTDASDGRPGTTVRFGATNMAHGPDLQSVLDPETYLHHRDSTLQQLASPPFSAPSDDAAVYQLAAEKEGQLAEWMLPEQALEGIETSLLFAAIPDAEGHRPWLAIGGQFGARSSEDVAAGILPPMVLTQLRSVALLDASGRALPDVAPQLALRRLMWVESHRVRENDPLFPFRLPLQTTAAQLQGLETIRMEVDVEAYEWVGTEGVKAGAHSQRNPAARILWTSAQRLSIDQAIPARAVREGLWTLAVPVDAEGREIPAAQLVAPGFSAQGTASGADANEPLAWELSTLPLRNDIATAQPMAGLQLRHYRWKQVPRQWTFRNARNMTEQELRARTRASR